jgi:iron complex transport system substrate-binding protein
LARPWSLRHRRVILVAAMLLAAALLGGCGTAAGRGDASSVRSGSSAPGYPVTVTDCGVTTTYQHAPRRVVTMNQHATEIMLALGLGNRMVGTAYMDDHIRPEYHAAYERIPVLAKKYPSYEALLKANPDFVFGGFDSAFSKEEGRSRQRLREAGVKTYLSVDQCRHAAVTMRQLWHELRTLGEIFNVENRANALVTKLKTGLATAKHKLAGVDPVRTFVYDSGTKAPLTSGAHGLANQIVTLAGGHNIFAGLNKGFVDVSWEQVIRRRPEAIVILAYGDTSVSQKKQTLLGKSGLANVPAIKHHRFAVLPLTATVLGVRAPHAVGDLARQLHPGRFHS